MTEHTKITTRNIIRKKKNKKKIAAITAYDYPTAFVADNAGIDIILVGDSLSEVVLGEKNTLKANMEIMIHHLKSVSYALKRALLVVDMPFGSYHISINKSIENAIRMVKEGNTEAVKIEGVNKKEKIIEKIIDADIPVMGHIGLTPQSINRLGGYKIQGKTKKTAKRLINEAKKLENIGVFSIVLECIPEEIAKIITNETSIPTIGIGAGRFCDGQIIVFHDLVGLNFGKVPKHVREYANVKKIMEDAVKNYTNDVKNDKFPSENEIFKLKKDFTNEL